MDGNQGEIESDISKAFGADGKKRLSAHCGRVGERGGDTAEMVHFIPRIIDKCEGKRIQVYVNTKSRIIQI